jgi:small conductance mechanosensitive channel
VLGEWLTRKTSLDIALRGLLVRVVKLVIIGVTTVVAAEKVGVPVTSLVAALGVAGVGIGLAMQGVLSNVIAGMTISFIRPFKTGEHIDVLSEHGEAVNITLFSTTLRHADRSLIIIPNRQIEAIDLARTTVRAHARVLRDPEPLIGVRELADSGIALSIRAWVSLADHEQAQLELYQAIVEAYREHRVEIPFPQREIRLLDADAIGAGLLRTGARGEARVEPSSRT